MKNSKSTVKLKALGIEGVLDIKDDVVKHKLKFGEIDKDTRLKVIEEVKTVSTHAAGLVSEILENELGIENINLIKEVKEKVEKKNAVAAKLFELKQNLANGIEKEANKQISTTRLKMEIIEAENELLMANSELLKAYAAAEENVFINQNTVKTISDLLNQRVEVAYEIDNKIDLLKTQINILMDLREQYFTEIHYNVTEKVKEKLCGIGLNELIYASQHNEPVIRSYISPENV